MSDITREEASEWLIAIKEKYIYGGDEEYDRKRKLALDMGARDLKNIKALGQEMRKFRECIKDEQTLVGFNIAIAITNKYLAEGSDNDV